MRVAIIGAGWYGCHIASTLIDLGIEVAVYEREKDIFCGASGNNQSRTHLGFHYPRCSKTRSSSQKGYREFIDTYGFLTAPIPCNIYAVSNDSTIDYGTYLSAMGGLQYIEIEPEEYSLTNVEGAVKTGEKLIVIDAARRYFKETLADVITYNSKVTKVELENLKRNYDYVIDCTYKAYHPEDVSHYEPCVMFYMTGDDSMAITVMDGPFFSIYKSTIPGQVTFTSVPHTPIDKVASMAEARSVLASFRDIDAGRVFSEQSLLAKEYLPDFDDLYEYSHFVKAIRAVPVTSSDSRQAKVQIKDDVISVRPGKIDAIFSTAREIVDIMLKDDALSLTAQMKAMAL